MQPFIIFEGIASSGKTTLEQMLQEKLSDSMIISEEMTLMLLINNIDPQEAVKHLSVVLDEIEEQPARAFIIDRFHLTHAFRTSVDLSSFDEIEKRIIDKYKPLIALLQIHEDAISSRIEEASVLRGASWVKGKQGSLEEKIVYYKNQQRELMKLIKQSNLPFVIIETSDKDWSRYIIEIQNALK
ncbi:MAG: hypothetical protein WCK01_03335 [Candidatus Uhrbacteria bacterium]